MTMVTADTERALYLFYSSRTEPQILNRYDDALTYLAEADIRAEIVDVAEEPERAQEFDVHATPTVIVREGGEEHRHLGVVAGLKQVLEHDLYGKTLLHEIGFKEGRETADRMELAGADQEQVAEKLVAFIEHHGMQDVTVKEFDTDAAEADISMAPDPESDAEQRSNWHDRMGEFLGGFFTEVFQTGVMATEVSCAQDGDECVFTVAPNG